MTVPIGDRPANEFGDVVDGRAHIAHRPQRLPGERQSSLARGGQPHRAVRAIQQGLPEFPLQPGDLRAHGGLRDMDALRRAGEVRLLGHRDEILQLT